LLLGSVSSSWQSPRHELEPGKLPYPNRILLSLILLKLRALHQDFLHESFKFSSRFNAAHSLVIAVLNGKSTVPPQNTQDRSPYIRN